jgi:hypothetical protein
VQFSNSISVAGALLMGSFGFALTWMALRGGSKKQARGAGGEKDAARGDSKDLDRLFSDISKGLRFLASPSRFGGMGLMREKQYEVGRLLSELQGSLSRLEDGDREKYEARAHRILAQAARFGITLPPP